MPRPDGRRREHIIFFTFIIKKLSLKLEISYQQMHPNIYKEILYPRSMEDTETIEETVDAAPEAEKTDAPVEDAVETPVEDAEEAPKAEDETEDAESKEETEDAAPEADTESSEDAA